MKRIEPVHPRMRGERKRRMRILRRAVRFIPACAGNAFPQERLVISNTVHPRMRGERVVIVVPASVLPGSSPHARGTLRILIRRKPEKRFIPACAGNACPLFSIGHENPVHPRMRGERVISLRYDGFKGGSSPHARGTPFCTDIQVSPRRFIPACAGNALFVDHDSILNTVHPRMRGERSRYGQECGCYFGSSPHARGTLSVIRAMAMERRFIPACAGNAADRRA